MGSSIENTFSWSTNRSSMFHECKRKYYLNYYGFWGGWEPSSEDRVRQIYVLKKLQNRYMWLGTVVHESIERVLKHLRSGRELDRDEVVRDMVNRMREDFETSREGKYQLDPKNTVGLTEHEYDESIEDEEWVRIREKGINCIDRFYNSETYGTLTEQPPAEWMAIEGDLSGGGTSFADAFEMGPLQVWLKLDLAYRDLEGRVHIVDWKTGKGEPDFRQLYCYGYYAWKVWDEEPDQVTLTIENLARGKQYRESFTFDKLESLEEEIESDVLDMKEFLVDPEENTAREEDFPMIDDLNVCRRCRFRKICYPDGVPDEA